MMIWLMRATEKEGDGTLAQANRRIINPLREQSPARSRPRSVQGNDIEQIPDAREQHSTAP